MSRDMVPINMRDPFFKDPFFSSTWDEFDQMRNQMMEKSKDFWNKVDSDFANFDEAVRRQHEDMDRQMATTRPHVPRWAIPDAVQDKWSPTLMQDANEVMKVDEAGDRFEVTLDVSQYKPEELKVKTMNNVLSIEGKHEEGSDTGNQASAVVRQFSRKWTLPEDCRPEDVISNLSSDGILLVTAPKNPALTGPAQRAIR